MNNIKAIFFKQFTTQIKVPVMIGQGVFFLIMLVAFMFLLAEDEGVPCTVARPCVEAYLCEACAAHEETVFRLSDITQVGLFVIFFIGMAIVSSTSMMVQEDKTTKNLQFMAMANVKPYQYLLATVPALIIPVFILLILFGLLGGYIIAYPLSFMALTLSSAMVSIMLGVTIGLSKVPTLAMPIALLLGMGPQLIERNETLANTLQFLYVMQVREALYDLGQD